MMGRQTGDQSQLFYLFNLEERIPASHLLRRINPVVTGVLAGLREQLAPFYSEISFGGLRLASGSSSSSPARNSAAARVWRSGSDQSISSGALP